MGCFRKPYLLQQTTETSIKAKFDTYGFGIVLFEEFIDLFMDSSIREKDIR